MNGFGFLNYAAFPDFPYMDVPGTGGLEAIDQMRERQFRSFFKEIQQPELKLHHLLPETHEVQSNLRKVRLQSVLNQWLSISRTHAQIPII